MNRHMSFCFVLLALGMGVPAAAAADAYAETVQVFREALETKSFFQHAHGYAVFPTIAKGGIGIGGAFGEGRVYVGGRHVGNTSMGQVTIGFQLGGQAYSEIIFFQDERAFREFTSGNFEFGAKASAVALTAGAQAGAGTTGASASASTSKYDASSDGAWYKGMAVFTVTKGGLMYEASVGGQKFTYAPLAGQ